MIDEPLSPDESAFQKKVKAQKDKLIIYLAREITREFGPPPVVRGESRQDFDRILYGVIEDKCPTLHLEKMHVWDIATAIWAGRRIDLVTRKTLDRRIEEELEAAKQRREHQAKQAEIKKTDAESLAEIKNAPELTNAQKRDYELQMVREDTLDDFETLMNRAEVEAAHAKAFEQAMPLLTELDDMKSRNFFRRNISIEMWLTPRPLFVPAITAVSVREDARRRKMYENDWLIELDAAEKEGQEAPTRADTNSLETPTAIPTKEAAKIPTAPAVNEAADAPSCPTDLAMGTPAPPANNPEDPAAAAANKTVDRPTTPTVPPNKR